MSAAAQVLSMVLAAVVIVWHQQRTADKLRAEMRDEFGKLRAEVAGNGQRLARIEGYFGLGMPEAAATAAVGVRAFTPAGQIGPVERRLMCSPAQQTRTSSNCSTIGHLPTPHGRTRCHLS